MRRADVMLAGAGAALFVLACCVAQGGPLDARAYGDVHLYRDYAQQMASGSLPYRSFFDEYPPFAQPLFYAVHLLPGPYLAAFRWTMTVLGSGAIICTAATLDAVGAGRGRRIAALAVAAASPLLVGPVFLSTYDLWPAFLTAAAVLAFARRRMGLAGALLGLGTAAKIYPLALVPVALVVVWRRADVRRRFLAWYVVAFAAANLPFAVAGPGGLRFSYWVQLKRGLEVESIGGAALLGLSHLGVSHVGVAVQSPGSTNVTGGAALVVGAVTTIVEVAAIVLPAYLLRRGGRDALTAAATAVVGVVAFGKVLSPQYVDWLVPIAPAAGIVAAAVTAVVLGLTHVVFDRFHSATLVDLAHGSSLAWWALLRGGALILLYAVLVFPLARRRNASRK